MNQPYPLGKKMVMENLGEVHEMLDTPRSCRSCKHCYIGIVADDGVVSDTLMDTSHYKTWEFFYMNGQATFGCLCSLDDEGFVDNVDMIANVKMVKGVPECYDEGEGVVVVPRWVVKDEMENWREKNGNHN